MKHSSYEDELRRYFYSILYRFKEEHGLSLNLPEGVSLIKGKNFDALKKNGSAKINKISYRYFSDVSKRMLELCKLYFSLYDNAIIKNRQNEYCAVRNYNIVFEDMIDKMLSDDFEKLEKLNDNLTMSKLKYHADGKIIDHIFEFNSLIDDKRIYYIGDSKYYKPESFADELSTYKQFTYAKNVIQFNINLLNAKKNKNNSLLYRDPITEGYSISPNFFIYAYLDDENSFENAGLFDVGNPKKSFHFEERLFDRDTLFVQQYRINFLFVLNLYIKNNTEKIESFRHLVREIFRSKMVEYFDDSNRSEFVFYEKCFKEEEELKNYFNLNYRLLYTKCIATSACRLLLAYHKSDAALSGLLGDFSKVSLNRDA